jgi:acyl transferase domain-containing protein
MGEIADRYLQMLKGSLKGLGSREVVNNVKFYSSTAEKCLELGTDASYWYSNMIRPVQFSDAVERMIRQGGADHIIELGPSGALAGPISQIKSDMGGSAASVEYSATLERGVQSTKPLFELAGRMFMAGVAIDFTKVNIFHSAERPRVVFFITK